MARIKYGSLVTEISGTIGSATFQKGLYGNTLRSKPRACKSATAIQLHCRGLMAQCQFAWQALTVAQRTQWDLFVNFSGQTIRRDHGILTTGHALFLRYNYFRLLSGKTVLQDVTFITVPEWPEVTLFAVDGSIINMEFSIDLIAANIYPVISLSPKQLPSRAFSRVGLRTMQPLVVYSNTCQIEDTYFNIFGSNLLPGDLVHFEIKYYSTLAPIMSYARTGVITVTAI